MAAEIRPIFCCYVLTSWVAIGVALAASSGEPGKAVGVAFISFPTGTGVRFPSVGDAIAEGWVATVAGCEGGAQPIR